MAFVMHYIPTKIGFEQQFQRFRLANGRPIFVIILAIPRHQVGLSLARQSPSSIGLDTPLNTPSTSGFALAGKPSPGNHGRAEISRTPAKAKPQRKTPKRQNLRWRRTPANAQRTRRALAWVRRKATDFRRDE